MKKKSLIIVCALALILTVAIGGTVAWLTAETEKVTNTFTYGDINITLAESENLDLKMVPGNDITKDPKVTVNANSEDCYLFVKVEKSDNFDNFMTYEMAEGWNELTGEAGVYYREVDNKAADQVFDVLKGNKVTVGEDVSKEKLTALTDTPKPTLAFTAYAVQKANIADAAAAWAKI